MTTKNRIKAALIATALFALAPAAGAAELTVEITDIRTADGHVMVSLVDSADGWDHKAPPVAANGTKPANGAATLRFADLEPGNYALMVMHDENDNGSLDTNSLGMPLEGYGFSNNPEVMRRATFDEARFEVGATDEKVTIRLR